ncbi:MAG TPA: hypothetical protein VF647_02595 [Longimicrobium sp.]|jgi:hypothetical protein
MIPDSLPIFFVVLAVALAGIAAWAVGHVAGRRAGWIAAAVLAGWLAATGAAAAAGALRFWPIPPTMLLVVAGGAGGAVWAARSRLGARMAAEIPLSLLVGVQGFRLPLELMMHRAAEVGLMPVQMSFEGLNFDVVSGALAIVVGVLAAYGRAPRALVAAWAVLGSLLLANVLVIAVLSAPTPLRMFWNEPANVWITTFPYVWLPAVMVPAAIFGHLLVFRRLARDTAAGRHPSLEAR